MALGLYRQFREDAAAALVCARIGVGVGSPMQEVFDDPCRCASSLWLSAREKPSSQLRLEPADEFGRLTRCACALLRGCAFLFLAIELRCAPCTDCSHLKRAQLARAKRRSCRA